MEQAIIFGASKFGEIAQIMYREKVDVLFFVDNDKNKVGSSVNGIEVKRVEEVLNYPEVKILIASQHHKEIEKQLIDLGLYNIEVVSVVLNPWGEKVETSKENFKEINLGSFLKSVGSMKFNNLVFQYGASSGILDYTFLKALMIKFDLKNYLEIGTFFGESIDAVADVAEKTYSISLPNETLGYFFKERNMENFGRYFSYNKRNCIHFEEDSKTFNYSKINDNIDLVFIDGDHSYIGILVDTKKIFDFIDIENTFVVWHDFKYGKDNRLDTIEAIKEGVPPNRLGNVFGVDNNVCGIYIPNKFLNEFEYTSERNSLYSYSVEINPKLNKI